jgi:tetratricopeptide (TPR) repeat protein
VRQKTIHAYLRAGDLCAEVHLSKAGFEPGDQSLFEEILSTAKLLPDRSPAGNQGQIAAPPPSELPSSTFAKAANTIYSRTIRPQQPFIRRPSTEKQKHTLSKDYFRVLVDNLGMSYGISGRLQQAKVTFEYGLTQDPEYPMFYYNLACTYGETKNMLQAIEELRLAYEYKANIIAGETLPDPLKDDSFRFFVNDDGFVKAVTDMQK